LGTADQQQEDNAADLQPKCRIGDVGFFPALMKNGAAGGEAARDRHFRQRLGIGAADTRKIAS